jgi:hypothetical protein
MTDVVRVSKSLPIDRHVDRLADYKEAQRMIEFWKKRLDSIKAEFVEILGDFTVGTVNGEEVLFYEPKEQFQGAEFKKDYPDMARLYTREVVKKELDTQWLRQERPDLWRQYQTRAMRNTFEA